MVFFASFYSKNWIMNQFHIHISSSKTFSFQQQKPIEKIISINLHRGGRKRKWKIWKKRKGKKYLNLCSLFFFLQAKNFLLLDRLSIVVARYRWLLLLLMSLLSIIIINTGSFIFPIKFTHRNTRYTHTHIAFGGFESFRLFCSSFFFVHHKFYQWIFFLFIQFNSFRFVFAFFLLFTFQFTFIFTDFSPIQFKKRI